MAFGWAREKLTQLHRELRQCGRSAPLSCRTLTGIQRNTFRSTNTLSIAAQPQSACVQTPQRWLVWHLGRLATYLVGGVAVRLTRRKATGHYIGYFEIIVFVAQRTRSPTDAAWHRFTAVLLWLVQTMADVCVLTVSGPGLYRTVRRIQLPVGVVIHRNVARSYGCFDISSKSPRDILEARRLGGKMELGRLSDTCISRKRGPSCWRNTLAGVC